jgi:hypothetical protein
VSVRAASDDWLIGAVLRLSGGDDVATFIATVLGGVAALLALSAWVQGRYRRTLGRRRDRYERLARLGTGAQLSFFVAVLGEPPAIRRTVTTNSVELVGSDDPRFDPAAVDPDDEAPMQDIWQPRDFTECFFIDRDYYVQSISDHEDTVLAFSVTVRRRRFRPTLWVPAKLPFVERLEVLRSAHVWPRPLATVKLGRTRFADLDSKDPEHWAPPHFRAGAGARWVSYSEFHSYGNPGHYQTYVLSAGSNAPGRGELHRVFAVVDQAGFAEWPYPDRWDPDDWQRPPPSSEEPDWADIPDAALLRKHTAITSYTVIGPGLWYINFPSTFGPHGDEVRTLP